MEKARGMSGRDRFPGYVEKLAWVDKWPKTPFGSMLLHEQREFIRTAIRTVLEVWDQRFEAGFAAADVEAEERQARLRDALEDAESFIEQVETWSGSDPDEVHEALADIRAALAVSSTENEEAANG